MHKINKTLNEEKYPWCLMVNCGSCSHIFVNIDKMSRHKATHPSATDFFQKPGLALYITDDNGKKHIDLSKSIYVYRRAKKGKVIIVSTTLSEGLTELEMEVERIKSNLVKAGAPVEWLEAIDRNVENCVAKAKEVEKKLKNGIISDGYGAATCYSDIYISPITLVYEGNGIKPNFNPTK